MGDRVWAWDRDVPLRWVLIDAYDETEAPVGLCAEIDGLFVDPEPLPPPEHYTLLGCRPDGALAEALRQVEGGAPGEAGKAWLPSILLSPVHDQREAAALGCAIDDVVCCCAEELMDVTVLGQLPSDVWPGLVDVDLRGNVRIVPEEGKPAYEAFEQGGFRLAAGKGESLGRCRSVGGVFRARPEPLLPPVTLVGCLPDAALTAAIEARSARQRFVAASLHTVDRDGRAMSADAAVYGEVTWARPSRLGGGLLDITLSGERDDPLPSGTREIWQMWYEGRPARPNLWAPYDRAMRHEWSRGALRHHLRERPDRPAGATYHLDGRFVTDIEGFYCAIGEAINGPGGYFGGNLDALDDCLRGKWGASTPFRLVWHDSQVARRHLVPGYDRCPYDLRRWGPAITLDYLLALLARANVEVELR